MSEDRERVLSELERARLRLLRELLEEDRRGSGPGFSERRWQTWQMKSSDGTQRNESSEMAGRLDPDAHSRSQATIGVEKTAARVLRHAA